ncbi:Putative protein of unknown function [Podospora comata]|uniref:Uncharacterized protein n=1 Tax=Podospora comata TaxID=48703 RepID=A0ABY6SEE3_PODCO|nr:Putative protein of unknown function [Podospora comata]
MGRSGYDTTNLGPFGVPGSSVPPPLLLLAEDLGWVTVLAPAAGSARPPVRGGPGRGPRRPKKTTPAKRRRKRRRRRTSRWRRWAVVVERPVLVLVVLATAKGAAASRLLPPSPSLLKSKLLVAVVRVEVRR